ncbi:MAG: TerC family protein [candidate division KSB1 bacterium]
MQNFQIEIIMWSAFGLFIVTMMLLDLGVFNRKSHTLSLKEAAIWSALWIVSALLFNVAIHQTLGAEAAGEFLAGYLIEKSLSVDNIFVFIIIFSYFKVSPTQQPRVLKWGILGALVMRGVLIFAGAALIKEFHWMTYVFGGILMLTVVKMIFLDSGSFNPNDNPLLRLFRRFMPVTTEYHNDKFFIRDHARRLMATPLLLVVIVVESSDLIFALDSIPAIFAISHDPFIVYTSNIFAIMGLRALYFLLAGIADQFHYLKPGIILILFFVAVKMLIVELYKIPTFLSLLVIGCILAGAIIISIFLRRKEAARAAAAPVLQPEKTPQIAVHTNGHARSLPQEVVGKKPVSS